MSENRDMCQQASRSDIAEVFLKDLKMGKKIAVVLNTISFENQTQAFAFFQEMLQRYVPGEQVSPEDEKHLAELFKRHPSYADKVGPGVKYFEIMPERFNSQCFCAVLRNGAKEGFSYKKCVTMREV